MKGVTVLHWSVDDLSLYTVTVHESVSYLIKSQFLKCLQLAVLVVQTHYSKFVSRTNSSQNLQGRLAQL